MIALVLACSAAVAGASASWRAGGHSGGGAALALDEVSAPLAVQLPAELNFGEVRPAPLLTVSVDSDADRAAAAVSTGGAISVLLTADGSGALGVHIAPAGGASAGGSPVAWARYNNTVRQNGWGYFAVAAAEDASASDEAKMYAAGFAEGLVSAQQIRDFQHNAGVLVEKDEDKHNAMGNIRALFEKDLEAIMHHSGMKPGASLSRENAPTELWWRQARLALMQTWGMLDAYNRQVDAVKGKPMSMIDLLMLNSDGETPELETAYDMEEVALRQSAQDGSDNSTDMSDDATDKSQVFLQRRTSHEAMREAEAPRERLRARRRSDMLRLDDQRWRNIKQSSGRCSALVRLTKDNADLMVGHTTFSDYSEMNRIFKYYDLPVGDATVRRMGFSSYPGVAGSTDDYYLLDTGLVVTETTVSMLTDEPYDKLQDSDAAIPDFMRIMIANRLSASGQDWVDHMKKSATGTYSSQWMVVDYNKFQAGEQLQSGALFVLEQVPGISHAQDMTSRLQETGFWASENRAWYKDVRDSIGATEAEELHGALFSADQNPRAHIFAATATEVQDLAGMRDEMQRNRWPHEVDGGIANTPDHAISARGDLDKQNPNPNGGVDSKVTNACLAKRLTCNAISGPTHQSQKPFSWTDGSGRELYPSAPHDGLPDVWNFDWVQMTPDGEAALGDGGCAP